MEVDSINGTGKSQKREEKVMSTQKSQDRHTPLPLPGNPVRAPEQRYVCRDLSFD